MQPGIVGQGVALQLCVGTDGNGDHIPPHDLQPGKLINE